jgi:DNA-binding NtrC family response regulator
MNESLVTGAPVAQPQLAAMIGKSEAFRRAHRLLQRYAACNAPVLIEGETGTGKELAAREIHYASARSLGPFVPVNCGALPDNLLESELFGHRRGAFTDAKSSEPGLVEYARGGSLFLDEIDSLSPHAQTIFLRFLQNGEFRKVGERPLRTADVRIVAAANVSLAAEVDAGRFRRDLLYRLNPLFVILPPLRERDEDVILLAQHMLAEVTVRLGIAEHEWTRAALEALMRHHWPGNVRELENVIVRTCMRSDGTTIGMSELVQAEPDIWRMPIMKEASDAASLDFDAGFIAAKQRAIRSFERNYLVALMDRAGGNISRAAAMSGTERRQLGKLLKRNSIERYGAVDA